METFEYLSKIICRKTACRSFLVHLYKFFWDVRIFFINRFRVFSEKTDQSVSPILQKILGRKNQIKIVVLYFYDCAPYILFNSNQCFKFGLMKSVNTNIQRCFELPWAAASPYQLQQSKNFILYIYYNRIHKIQF